MEELLVQVCSQRRLDRDAAIAKLVETIANLSDHDIIQLEAAIILRLGDNGKGWEERHGCLYAAKSVIAIGRTSENFRTQIETLILSDLIEDQESRVRLACAEVLGEFCRLDGVVAYERYRNRLITLISDNLKRAEQCSDNISRQSTDSDASEVLRDTAGWGCLETSMKCLQHCIEGCSTTFLAHIDADLLCLIQSATKHRNHFVRETAFQLLAAIGSCFQGCDGTLPALPETLATGLSDGWSPVQRAASVATRNFLLNCSNDEVASNWLPILLPSMCLNRFHAAEGVRNYSVDTWIKATKGNGVALVTIYLSQVVSYYISKVAANHREMREGCCHAISELAAKIDRSALEPHASVLLDSLLFCLQDENGMVRDSACLASNSLLRLFPDVARPLLNRILPLFLAQLHDCIPLYRQAAAEGLASLVGLYGAEVWEWLLPRIQHGLNMASEQPTSAAEDSRSTELDTAGSGITALELERRIGENDPGSGLTVTHTCRSLAPMTSDSCRPCVCCGQSFRRQPTPWEMADGTIRLIAELCAVQQIQAAILEHHLITLAFDACSKTAYSQRDQLVATVCKCAPKMISGIGKVHSKPYLQPLIEGPLLHGLMSEVQLTSNSAEDCLVKIAQIFGKSIVRGRIEMTRNMRYLDIFDRLVQ